jgi:Ala-tRNA(Pro) deacylase
MPSSRVKEFLDGNAIKYVCIAHSPAYTARDIATSAHVSVRELAKTVIVFLDDKLAMAVVPASARVNLARLKEIAGATAINVATEREFRQIFPDCETGAMPPFGNLYSIPVYLDESLYRDELTFNAGSHRELIQMKFDDFVRLAQPIPGRFATPRLETWAAGT